MQQHQGSDVIAFRLDRPTLLLNQTIRMHWTALRRHNRQLGGLVRLATHGQRPAVPWDRALLRIERRSLRTPDQDGLVGGAKGLIDCLLPQGTPFVVTTGSGRSKWTFPHPHGLGIVRDDGPDCLTLSITAVRVARAAEQCTLVEVHRL